uniref:Putative secreted protein n=1 Tax=Anopheles triannulatus TaxID=58253 RepID=A0A2M4B7K7_9DIPT
MKNSFPLLALRPSGVGPCRSFTFLAAIGGCRCAFRESENSSPVLPRRPPVPILWLAFRHDASISIGRICE